MGAFVNLYKNSMFVDSNRRPRLSNANTKMVWFPMRNLHSSADPRRRISSQPHKFTDFQHIFTSTTFCQHMHNFLHRYIASWSEQQSQIQARVSRWITRIVLLPHPERGASGTNWSVHGKKQIRCFSVFGKTHGAHCGSSWGDHLFLLPTSRATATATQTAFTASENILHVLARVAIQQVQKVAPLTI